MNDVDIQLGEIDKEKVELENMAAELKAKMVSDFSREEAIREIKAQLDEFRNAVEKDNIPWKEKRKIIEMFVREVQINLTRDQKPLILIETIPFRKGIEPSIPEGINPQRMYM